MINYLSIHYASPIIPLTDKRTLSYGTPIRDGYFSSNRNASRGWGAKCRVLTWLFPSSATGLLMSPRSRTRSVRIIVLTYRAFVARPESISNMFRWNLQSAACVPCVCLCLCVHPRFAWKKRNWQMRMSTRNVTREVSSYLTALRPRICVWLRWRIDLIGCKKVGWFFWKRSVIFCIYIGNRVFFYRWMLFVSCKNCLSMLYNCVCYWRKIIIILIEIYICINIWQLNITWNLIIHLYGVPYLSRIL